MNTRRLIQHLLFALGFGFLLAGFISRFSGDISILGRRTDLSINIWEHFGGLLGCMLLGSFLPRWAARIGEAGLTIRVGMFFGALSLCFGISTAFSKSLWLMLLALETFLAALLVVIPRLFFSKGTPWLAEQRWFMRTWAGVLAADVCWEFVMQPLFLRHRLPQTGQIFADLGALVLGTVLVFGIDRGRIPHGWYIEQTRLVLVSSALWLGLTGFSVALRTFGP